MNEFLEKYYNEYDEENRLVRDRVGQVEYLTTRKYIDEYLTDRDVKILEVGAGTGRYSVTLAKEGYDVTAVELVEHNLGILKSKLDGSENILAVQGNALDLTAFDDNTFDLTLVLGPMYHLYTKDDKITALKEAVRVTKYMREYLEEMDDETFEKWLSYHFATCERQDLIGATNHSFDILRKV